MIALFLSLLKFNSITLDYLNATLLNKNYSVKTPLSVYS